MEPTAKQLNFLTKSAWRLSYLERDIRVAKGEQDGNAMLTDTAVIDREVRLGHYSLDKVYSDMGVMSILIDAIRRKIDQATKELDELGDYCKAHGGKIMAKCSNGGCS